MRTLSVHAHADAFLNCTLMAKVVGVRIERVELHRQEGRAKDTDSICFASCVIRTPVKTAYEMQSLNQYCCHCRHKKKRREHQADSRNNAAWGVVASIW